MSAEQNIVLLLKSERKCLDDNMALTMCIVGLVAAHKMGDEKEFEAEVAKAKTLSPLLQMILEPVKYGTMPTTE